MFDGDMRWHLLALDGMTGRTKLDLPGRFLSGLRDLDGDGLGDLFCTLVQKGPRIPDPSDLEVVSFKDGKTRTIWQLPGASFETCLLSGFPSNVNNGSFADPMQTVLCQQIEPGGASVFFTSKEIDTANMTELTAWQMDHSGHVGSIGNLVGPRLEALALQGGQGQSANILLQTTTFEKESATLTLSGFEGEVLMSKRVAGPVSPVVVGRLTPRARPVVVVQGANESVDLLRPSDQGENVELLWRATGRGMTCNNTWEGVLLADLQGQGNLSIVLATRGKDDCARIQVLSHQGEEVWSREFDQFPGAPPGWNVPGLMYWQGGYFTRRQGMDILMQMRRVGGESYFLDGRNGNLLWRQWKGREGRGFGRWWMTMYDYDADGLEDVLNVYPDMFCIAHGPSGKLLAAEEMRNRIPGVGDNGYWGKTAVADFLGNGQQQILFANRETIALLERQGKPIWSVSMPKRTGSAPGIGDADGDGKLDLFVSGPMREQKLVFKCLEATSGGFKWELLLPNGSLTSPVTADIDQDGRDECIFSIDNTLYAIGSNGSRGQIEWRLDFSARLGPVAIADVYGDGTAQIVVVGADGYVYGIQ